MQPFLRDLTRAVVINGRMMSGCPILKATAAASRRLDKE
jgi:hypothetical protein